MVKNLWKGKRGAQDSAPGAEGENHPPVQPDYESVGDTLRKQREERGEDLRYVAQMLRIRYPYLKAIEDGQPDELPGPTYAVGFVRTYADHLGLPIEELVQRFKEEAANLQARADLHFPAPIPEGKIPSGAVLVIAVVLAAAVYGGWIYLSSEDQQVAEIVPQLPNQISEIIKGDPNLPADKPAGEGTGTTAESESMPAAKSDAAANETAAPAVAEQEASAERPETAAAAPDSGSAQSSASDTSVADSAGETARTEPSDSTDREIPVPPGSETAQSEGASENESAISSFFSSDSAPTDSNDSTASENGNEPSTEADRAPPKTYGEENSGARIVIHAAADSWVEVRDSGTDELLLTRVLFKGDRYLVPDRSGLTLLTGNAGGLRIVVDGADAPAIGPLGAVRRNVLLEPSPLLAGNATRPSDNGAVPTQSQTSEGDFQAQ